jgi:hypothetical protein
VWWRPATYPHRRFIVRSSLLYLSLIRTQHQTTYAACRSDETLSSSLIYYYLHEWSCFIVNRNVCGIGILWYQPVLLGLLLIFVYYLKCCSTRCYWKDCCVFWRAHVQILSRDWLPWVFCCFLQSLQANVRPRPLHAITFVTHISLIIESVWYELLNEFLTPESRGPLPCAHTALQMLYIFIT